MNRLADISTGPESFGDYLCLVDAADLVGSRLIEDWRRTDLNQLGKLRAESNDVAAWDRVETASKRIFEWLVGGRVRALGQDEEGAYTDLDRQRLSKPFFRIDIPRSQFAWAPEEWDVIFIGRSDLARFLDTLRPSTGRKPITYDWCEICCLAWQLALDDLALRKQSALVAAIQDRYHLLYDQHPDEKELRDLARTIIDHLGSRILSREVSELETPPEQATE